MRRYVDEYCRILPWTHMDVWTLYCNVILPITSATRRGAMVVGFHAANKASSINYRTSDVTSRH